MKMRPIEPIAKRAYELWVKKSAAAQIDRFKVWDKLQQSEQQVWLDIASLVWDYVLADTGD